VVRSPHAFDRDTAESDGLHVFAVVVGDQRAASRAQDSIHLGDGGFGLVGEAVEAVARDHGELFLAPRKNGVGGRAGAVTLAGMMTLVG
jgi:hypothetical protein